MNTENPKETSFFQQLKLYYQSRHAPPLTRIEENEGSHLATATIAVISLLIFVFIIWASFTSIEEIAVTFGEVIPKSKVYSIQHLEGGVIGNIMVKEGDEVQAGDTLVIFDPTIPKLELEQIRARNAALIASTQYLQELLLNEAKSSSGSGNATSGNATGEDTNKVTTTTTTTPNPTTPSASTSTANGSKASSTTTSTTTSTTSTSSNAEQKNMYQSSSEAKNLLGNTELQGMKNKGIPHSSISSVTDDESKKIVESFKSQAVNDLSQFESILEILRKRLAILVQEKDMYEELLKTGAVSRKDYLALLRTVTQVQEDISKTQAARVETQYAIDKLEDRINRIEVKAPIHGLVKGMQLHVGNVIQPGGILMEVVPIENLMVETRITVTDIGHVKVGNTARIKVAAYDYTRYGFIEGKLVNISATTFMEPGQAKPFYKGLIKLNKTYVGDDPQRNRLLPGMTVQADINTGAKSLLHYLLRPVEVLFSSSFREY